MDSTPAELWIDACAHRLQRQWRTVDPEVLEEVAGDLWRDPRLRAMTPAEAATRWLEPVAQPHESKNGILAKIPGDLIARGSQTLPRPADGQPEEQHVVLDTGHLGQVRITYSLSSSQHHKNRNWFWTACHAKVVE